jgi:hypothetical protein
MIVEAEELRFRVGLRHDDRRGAVAASDIGDLRAGFQLRFNPVKGGYPVLNQVGVVARPEEVLGPGEKALRMLVPADTLAGAESLGNLEFIQIGGLNDVEGAGEESRRAFFGKNHA